MSIRLRDIPFLRMVSLLEILETSAESWWRLSSLLGQTLVILERAIEPINQDTAGVIGGTLGEILREIEQLKLISSIQQLSRIREYVDNGNIYQAKLRGMLVELHQRILDELESRFFLSIPPENIEYYRQTAPLFGPLTETRFPEQSEDISEAGKCLALGRTTAAVFHLMRVMERAVQRFGTELGVVFAQEKTWQPLLDEINKQIRLLDQKQPRTKALAQSASHLYNVKVAWRNEVMHPKQTYTEAEAKNIFSNVRTFINDLANAL